MSEWFVKPRAYSDPETGEESTLYAVMCPTPETWPDGQPWRGTGAWGDAYRVSVYCDEKAAQEHARTHRKPHGYG